MTFDLESKAYRLGKFIIKPFSFVRNKNFEKMISIIICSRQLDIPQLLKDNISETIGVEFELVVIDNSENKYSIFQAYNEGARRAQYPYLCFMHEDILFRTQNWGNIIIEHFKDEEVGLIGVDGGHYMLNTPSSWWHSGVVSKNYIQTNDKKETSLIRVNTHKDNNFKNEKVVAVDGLWFCIERSIFAKIQFDETNFNSFHCYDLDICFQIRALNKKVIVVFDILIQHLSNGSIDEKWFNQINIFYNKWKHILPQMSGVNFSTDDYIAMWTDFVKNSIIYSQHNEERINKIINSKEYKIGKFIIKPLRLLKSKINKVKINNF